MVSVTQACRICGVCVPAGFTNCDGCYDKTDKVAAKKIKTFPDKKSRNRPDSAVIGPGL